jgi:hypothetical protein
MAHHGPFIGTPEPVSIMRLHDAANPKDAADDLPYDAVFEADRKVVGKILQSDPALRGIERRIWSRYHFVWGLGYLAAGSARKARRQFWESLRCNPFQLRAYYDGARSLLR